MSTRSAILARVRRAFALVAVMLAPTAAVAQTVVRWDPALIVARGAFEGAAPARARALFPGAHGEGVGVVLRFSAPPSAADLARLERAGAVLPRFDRPRGTAAGRVITAGTMVGAFVPWASLDDVARVPGLVRIALGRAPGERATMDLSVREIGAQHAWAHHDATGTGLTGRGITIGDMDTAVDFQHPMFFRADGGQFAWIDVDHDGRFSDGVDAVDLDGDGLAAPEETLRLQDARHLGSGANADGRLQASEDWLWADEDGDGRRDSGLEGGYAEDDPCLGERLFIVDDADQDDTLDLGETLTGLGTSKIAGIYAFPGRTFLRGDNLLDADLSDDEHGTGVTSILAGGWARRDRRFAGVAPDAELVVATRSGADSGVVVTAPWAVDMGADVVLYEYGAIAGRFLDGDDEDDRVIDELVTARGVPQVTPTGNWGDSGKTLRAWIEAGSRLDEIVRIPERWELGVVYVTLRWRRPEVPLEGTLTSPSGVALPLAPDTDTIIDGLHLMVNEDVSERGTLARSVVVFRADGGDVEIGDWPLVVGNPDAEAVELFASVVDDVSGFGGGATFVNWIDPMASVASPATADHAIAVGSYSTRASWGADRVGQLSGFSGQGARLDGAAVVDVTAPGDYDVFWAQSRRARDDWGFFSMGGGTSAAGPHVAGAAALLLQARPDATPDQIEAALRAGALADEFVGEAPNLQWGAGKLRIVPALEALGPAPLPPEPDAGPVPDAGIDASVPDAGTDAAADAGDAGHADGGCGCRVGAGDAGSTSLLLALVALLVARRRRAG